MSSANNHRIRSLPFWAVTLLATACVLSATWYLVFIPVQVFVGTEPDQLFADPSSSLIVRIMEHNRLGFQTPFHHAAMRCLYEEGMDISTLAYEQDSTAVRIRSNGQPGVVTLHIVTDASMFPLYLRLTVQPLLARQGRPAPAPVTMHPDGSRTRARERDGMMREHEKSEVHDA